MAQLAPTVPLSAFCPILQKQLVDIAPAGDVLSTRNSAGYLMATLDPINQGGTSYKLIGDNGRYQRAEVIYYQRGTEADLTTVTNPSLQDTCLSAGDPIAPLTLVVDITRRVQRDLEFQFGDMRALCEGAQSIVLNQIMRQMNALTRQINADFIAAQITNVGLYQDGSTAKAFTFTGGTPPGIDQAEVARMLAEYRRIGGFGAPIVVGGDRIFTLSILNGMGCCNNSGVDLAQANRYYYPFFDEQIEAATAANTVFILQPGAVRFLEAPQYSGDYAMRNGANGNFMSNGMFKSEVGTIIDPMTGLNFDIRAYYDDECDIYRVRISKNYGFFFLPSDLYAATDINNGVRGTLRATI